MSNNGAVDDVENMMEDNEMNDNLDDEMDEVLFYARGAAVDEAEDEFDHVNYLILIINILPLANFLDGSSLYAAKKGDGYNFSASPKGEGYSRNPVG